MVDYKVDYILYYSNINKDILKGFVEVAGEGIIRSTNDEVKRILIEVLYKPEEDIESKIKMLSKAFKNILKSQE